MRKTCIILLSLLVLGACTNKYEKIATFDIKIESVFSTRATISVKPDNNDVWYSYVLVPDGSMESLVKEEYVGEAMIARCEEIYNFIKQSQSEYADYEDIFFYNGPREHYFTNLEPDLHHKVFFFQVNPVTHEIIGDYIVREFTTAPLNQSNLTFDISGQGNWVQITPSNDNESYVWDFERKDIIETDYSLSPRLYLYSLAQMYHDYGFLDSKVSKGRVEYVFGSSERDRNVIEGTSYILSAAGIDNRGEFTTQLTSVEIIYHEDKGIEIIEYDF